MKEKTEQLYFIKTVELDSDSFYLFRDSKGVKRWIEIGNYTSFNLKPGMQIQAITNEKGCAGEAITNLIHPYYREKQEYQFTIVRIGSFCINNENTKFIVISDQMQTEYKITVPFDNRYHIGDSIRCRLLKQHRGHLQFEVKKNNTNEN